MVSPSDFFLNQGWHGEVKRVGLKLGQLTQKPPSTSEQSQLLCKLHLFTLILVKASPIAIKDARITSIFEILFLLKGPQRGPHLRMGSFWYCRYFVEHSDLGALLNSVMLFALCIAHSFGFEHSGIEKVSCKIFFLKGRNSTVCIGYIYTYTSTGLRSGDVNILHQAPTLRRTIVLVLSQSVYRYGEFQF